MPMKNNEIRATVKVGNRAKNIAPINALENARINTGLSEYLSTRIPAGMDITPYATKKAKGRKPARPKLNLKLVIISGIMGPRIFVRNEITKKIIRISATIKGFRFIRASLNNSTLYIAAFKSLSY